MKVVNFFPFLRKCVPMKIYSSKQENYHLKLFVIHGLANLNKPSKQIIPTNIYLPKFNKRNIR